MLRVGHRSEIQNGDVGLLHTMSGLCPCGTLVGRGEVNYGGLGRCTAGVHG